MRYYQSGSYYEGGGCGYTSYAEQEKSLRLTFRRLLAELAKQGMTGGSLLEVGCGQGFFLDEAREHFPRRVGTEYSSEAAASATRYADLVWTGGLDVIPDREFDLIAALQVIEHVYDPHDFVARLASRLKPGGRLLLATPNAGSLWLPLLRGRWPSFKFPEHVVFYDSKSLRALLVGAGLTQVRRVRHPHAFPLREVIRKAGLPETSVRRDRSIWVPGTVLAMVGQRGP